jgi:hypothetical protein
VEGWIKLHRKLLENPIVCKDADHLAVWTYLLLKATHRERDSIFKGERITLKPGQLIAGRKSIASFLKINEIKVQRILKLLENEHQIEQQTSNRNRLITILNWDLYQGNEQQDEQQMNNKRTTDEQQMNTYKNIKNDKNNKKNIYAHFTPPTLEEVISYCKERNNSVDPQKWYDFYSAKGWMIGKNKMKDWKAAVRTWERGCDSKPQKSKYRDMTNYQPGE